MSIKSLNELEYKKLIEENLFSVINENAKHKTLVNSAMKYSLEVGGKRLRSMLFLEFFRIFSDDKNFDAAMPTALAIEMFHTFSLIHDDLPCMDNDDLRRGKPSCHKAFPEATALLAGDALPLLGLELIAETALNKDNKYIDRNLMVIKEMCAAAGAFGMIGGQQLDLDYEKLTPDEDKLILMYRLKTGALLKAACKAGCILAGADDRIIKNAGEFAENLGLAFQIIDDILDVTGDEILLGKPIGSDFEQGKNTYVSLFGMKKAEEKAKKLTGLALYHLNDVPDNIFLNELTSSLLHRIN